VASKIANAMLTLSDFGTHISVVLVKLQVMARMLPLAFGNFAQILNLDV
jgi:hypothetical protein